MFSTVCPHCGPSPSSILFTKGDLTRDITNVICHTCGLVYIWPRPLDHSFSEYQGSSGQGSGHHHATREEIEKKISSSDKKIKSTVADFLATYLKPNMHALDVGAGLGVLLSILRERFSIVPRGIELNHRDVVLAQELFNIPQFEGTLAQFATSTNETFDLITLHHTFEHFLDPRAELRNLKKLLKPGGILYIAVPNILNIKKRPDIFFIYGHACTYSPYSLSRMLTSEGFAIISYNKKGGYPGGMECVAVPLEDSRARDALHLRDGISWRRVYLAVHLTHYRFAILRIIRDVSLFFVSSAHKQRISQFISQWLKHR